MHLKILLSKIFQNIRKDASFFFTKTNYLRKITNDFFLTNLFIMSTKLTTVASYGTWLQWKTISCSHPSMVHTRHVSLFTLLLAFLPLSHQMYTSSHPPWTSFSLSIKGIPLETQSDLNNYGHYFNFGED
jgi:uncharacterized membrane protein